MPAPPHHRLRTTARAPQPMRHTPPRHRPNHPRPGQDPPEPGGTVPPGRNRPHPGEIATTRARSSPPGRDRAEGASMSARIARSRPLGGCRRLRTGASAPPLGPPNRCGTHHLDTGRPPRATPHHPRDPDAIVTTRARSCRTGEHERPDRPVTPARRRAAARSHASAQRRTTSRHPGRRVEPAVRPRPGGPCDRRRRTRCRRSTAAGSGGSGGRSTSEALPSVRRWTVRGRLHLCRASARVRPAPQSGARRSGP